MSGRGPRIPIHGFVEGDVLGVLVLCDVDASARTLAQQVLQAAAPRVRPFAGAQLWWQGRPLDGERSLSEHGLGPLSVVQVRKKERRHGV